MAEYIERKAALEICETEYQNRLRMLDYIGDTVAWNIGGEIKALPAADAVPVVRCRGCKYSTLPSMQTQIYGKPGTLTCCNRKSPCNHRNVTSDDYCKQGERK